MRPRLAAMLLLSFALPARAHDPDARIEQLGRRLAVSPGDLEALVERARLKRLSGELTAAFLDAERGVQLAAENAEARAERGLCLEALGHRARALADLDAGLGAHPKDPLLRLARARVHETAGRLEAAIADLDVALESRPEPDTFLDRSKIVHRRYGIEAAIESLSDAHRRTGAPLMLVERLRFEREARRWSQALATATLLHEAAPEDPEAMSEWGRALSDAGRRAEAARVLRQAEGIAKARLEQRPTAMARLVWAKVLAAAGRRSEALEEARAAAQAAVGWHEAADLVRALEPEVVR